MKIIIETTEERIDHQITLGKPTNDEISRVITHFEMIKQELLKELKFEYEIDINENKKNSRD